MTYFWYKYTTNKNCFADYTQVEDFTQSLVESDKSYNIRSPQHRVIKILDKAAQNSVDMTVTQAVNTMSALFNISKNMKDMRNMRKIEKHEGFISLCDVVNKNIRILKKNEIIEILKILTFLNIPDNSISVQSLLQMIRINVNDMSLQDIIFTVFLLKNMDSTPLRDALLIALPLVFEINLPTKLESDDINLLNWSIRFVNENNIKNEEVHDILFKLLLKHKNNMTEKIAWSIFLTLCRTSYLPPLAFDVLNNAQQILISNAKELSISKIINVLDNLVFVIAKKYVSTNFYIETSGFLSY